MLVCCSFSPTASQMVPNMRQTPNFLQLWFFGNCKRCKQPYQGWMTSLPGLVGNLAELKSLVIMLLRCLFMATEILEGPLRKTD